MEREWVSKFASGEYLKEWHGFSPFYAGCFYGNDACLGGESKFHHCFDFFAGIGDVEWWITSELTKLSKQDSIELLEILTRNKKVNDFIQDNHNTIKELSDKLKLDGSYVIYRLHNKNVYRILTADDPESEFYKIMQESKLNPISGKPLYEQPVVDDSVRIEDVVFNDTNNNYALTCNGYKASMFYVMGSTDEFTYAKTITAQFIDCIEYFGGFMDRFCFVKANILKLSGNDFKLFIARLKYTSEITGIK